MGLSCYLVFFALQYYVGVGGLRDFNTLPHPLPVYVTVHTPVVISKVCLLKPDTGPCRGNIPMYYFSPSEKNCTKFAWGGCQGNGNRFDSFRECRSTCLSTAETRRTAPRYCQLSFDYGYCFGAQKRWYYDRLWKVCKQTIYSGCGGNKNNFYGFEQCDSICRLGKEDYMHRATTKTFNKYLIINPLNATSKRGQNQESATTVANTNVRVVEINQVKNFKK